MGTTNVTYGVTSTILQSYLPQVGLEGSDDLWTSARVTNAVAHASAKVNASILTAGITPSDIAADTDSVGYLNCQRLVAIHTLDIIIRGVAGYGAGVQDVLGSLVTDAREELRRIELEPSRLGWDDDTDTSPGVWTTVQGITTTDTDGNTTAVAERRWQDTDDRKVVW